MCNLRHCIELYQWKALHKTLSLYLLAYLEKQKRKRKKKMHQNINVLFKDRRQLMSSFSNIKTCISIDISYANASIWAKNYFMFLVISSLMIYTLEICGYC